MKKVGEKETFPFPQQLPMPLHLDSPILFSPYPPETVSPQELLREAYGGQFLYDAANRLLDDGTFTYTYDPHGNLTSKTNKSNPTEQTTYTHDTENQLTRIEITTQTSSSSKESFVQNWFERLFRWIHLAEAALFSPYTQTTTIQYAYDPLGRRIQKNMNGTLTRYVYDNEDILLEYDGTNTPRARFTHGPGVDEPLMLERDMDLNGSLETQLYYLQDGLGSITALVDGTGIVAQSYQYDSFGNLLNPLGSIPNPYTYTGREYDPESGFYYYRARYYDPLRGTFLQEDPELGQAFIPQTQNRYAYVSNNPNFFLDPFGRDLLVDDLGNIKKDLDRLKEMIEHSQGKFGGLDYETPEEKKRREEHEKHMRSLDRNKNGKIDPGEGFPLTDQQKRFDIDKDGILDEQETKNFIENTPACLIFF